MSQSGNANTGHFCWVDLAATDVDRAKSFYAELFGWTSHDHWQDGGVFSRLKLSGEDVGSAYQLSREQLDQGVPSHWTPYIQVADVEDVARRAIGHGGEVLVPPFVVAGIARIALIRDSVGARVGLWEPLAAAEEAGQQP
jgi:uncharacterized protein